MKVASSLILAVSSLLVRDRGVSGPAQIADAPAHVQNVFQFTIAAPLKVVAPLFGPNGERCWAGRHWDPEFLYPQPGNDIEGAVFTVQHDGHKSVWVNTRFDPGEGVMQYVSFIPDALVSTIDVKLTPMDSSTTGVEVTYRRTALSSAANEDVVAMGKSDSQSGPKWQSGIESCLKAQSVH